MAITRLRYKTTYYCYPKTIVTFISLYVNNITSIVFKRRYIRAVQFIRGLLQNYEKLNSDYKINELTRNRSSMNNSNFFTENIFVAYYSRGYK